MRKKQDEEEEEVGGDVVSFMQCKRAFELIAHDSLYVANSIHRTLHLRFSLCIAHGLLP